ncbi:DegT/DnrJ/EryC1/StrS family aminotransferase [Candidatus Omnitrophota bacterium]
MGMSKGMIEQSRPCLQKDDFNYISDILRTGQVAKGRFVTELEDNFSQMLKIRYSHATSSGTAALHLALLAMHIGPGDEVIIPAYTCTALLNAINYVNATAVMADIDSDTFNITKTTISKRVTEKTKAIIVTHTFGFPADLDDILKLGIPIIEDCAHSLGALYKGYPIGSKGLISVYSMYATKMIASGEGGMICTNDMKVSEFVKDLNNYDGNQYYKVRYNYKMSDLAGGLALSQFSKLGRFTNRRSCLALRYKESLEQRGVRFQAVLKDTSPSYYRFIIRVPEADIFTESLRAEGIICDRPVRKPLYAYFDNQLSSEFPETESVWRDAVSMPTYPSLSDEEVSRIINISLSKLLTQNIEQEF